MERNIRLNWSDIVCEAIKRRKLQKLSQEHLAILAGVSKPTLNNFEQGKTAIIPLASEGLLFLTCLSRLSQDMQ